MEIVENFINNNNLQDTEDIEALIELADLVRSLISHNQYAEINSILQYIVKNSYYEAFTWCMGLIQEELEKEEGVLQNFELFIGKSIPNYDEFIERLQVDFQVLNNGLETVCDKYGEVESIFNILIYRTCYKNIYLISSENFDTKDNDYVQYKLSFVKNEANEGYFSL